MRALAAVLTVLIAGLAPIGLAVPAAAAVDTVSVAADPSQISTALGAHFTMHTTVMNTNGAATGPLLAHLNVASIAGGVYVDPEDWSSSRSRTLPSLGQGESRQLDWEIQAVNAGSFAAYVVVLPYGGSAVGDDVLAVSPLVRVEVATRSTLSAGGALPVAVLVPLLLGLAAAGTRLRIRRRR